MPFYTKPWSVQLSVALIIALDLFVNFTLVGFSNPSSPFIELGTKKPEGLGLGIKENFVQNLSKPVV
jgi:hypothetical protein